MDAQRTEIPHTHRNIDISLYDGEVNQINIVTDSYNKLNSTVKSIKGYLTRGKLQFHSVNKVLQELESSQ